MTSKKTLLAQLRHAENKLAHKLEVMRQHRPGTPWHTRAMLEAESIRERIDRIRRQLEAK